MSQISIADLEAEQSRRDDMESLGYLLLYFLRGHLPWDGVQAETDQGRNTLIMDKKRSVSIDELCGGQPREISVYMEHVRSLGFKDRPNYSYLRKIFRSLFVRRGFEFDNVFDWTTKRYAEQHTHMPESL